MIFMYIRSFLSFKQIYTTSTHQIFRLVQLILKIGYKCKINIIL